MYNLPNFTKYSNHYQACFMTLCGSGVLVFYEGAPKNGKDQLDEHEETCPICKKIIKELDLKCPKCGETKRFYYSLDRPKEEELPKIREIRCKRCCTILKENNG